MAEAVTVMIVGAGPAGLATAACLHQSSIPYVIVDCEDCSASLWRKRAYDRLTLHLAKEFCELPYMSYPSDAPTYIPRGQFVQYLDRYIKRFSINPVYNTSVESSSYDESSKTWRIIARNLISKKMITYTATFLVVATGENSTVHIPQLPGLRGFLGEVTHSSSYSSGAVYAGKSVLVVGCGNSGMEIAYDLANYGAQASIVIRSPFHVMNKQLIRLGMTLAMSLPVSFVDELLVTLANRMYGDLSSYGIVRPNIGPLTLKAQTGRSAVIDVGTIKLIKEGQINVFGAISEIEGNTVKFEDQKSNTFDAILFATGYKSAATAWLKDFESLLNEDGMPKNNFPNHWKGGNGLYCAGFSRRGLFGIAMDAKNIASDIKSILYASGNFF